MDLDTRIFEISAVIRATFGSVAASNIVGWFRERIITKRYANTITAIPVSSCLVDHSTMVQILQNRSEISRHTQLFCTN